MQKNVPKAKIAVKTQKPKSFQNIESNQKFDKLSKLSKRTESESGDLPIATVVIKNSLNTNYKQVPVKSWSKVDQPSPLDDFSFIDSEQSIISTSSSASDDNYANELRDEPPKVLSHHASGESSESISEFGYKKLADKNHESCTDLSDSSGLNCFGVKTNYCTRLSPDKGVSIIYSIRISKTFHTHKPSHKTFNTKRLKYVKAIINLKI